MLLKDIIDIVYSLASSDAILNSPGSVIYPLTNLYLVLSSQLIIFRQDYSRSSDRNSQTITDSDR